MNRTPADSVSSGSVPSDTVPLGSAASAPTPSSATVLFSEDTADERADIGVVGLGVMGSSLARNLAHHGHTVAVTNYTTDLIDSFVQKHGTEGDFLPATTLADFADRLQHPRVALIMVTAGDATDAVIHGLTDVFEPGDVIIDGGNSNFHDTIRREAEMSALGIHYIGAGISGGEEGALNGPSIMPGGNDDAWDIVRPLFESIAARAHDGTPCVALMGENGAGHFIKTVHNGIEYADMELISEAYTLLRDGLGISPDRIATIFCRWNSTELDSYLIEITSEILAHNDPSTGHAFIDIVDDRAGMKGTGTWTVQTALGLNVPAPTIAEAVFLRSLSTASTLRTAGATLPAPSPVGQTSALLSADLLARLGSTEAERVESIRIALYLSKIIAYAQGFAEIAAGASSHHWSIDMASVARIWRAGCIIRARFLDRIADAYASHPALPTLLAAPDFRAEIDAGHQRWRDVITVGMTAGIPLPAFASTLTYYDAARAARLPTALIQAQRDYFGAHTYRRVDAPESRRFHTRWSDDLHEVDVTL